MINIDDYVKDGVRGRALVNQLVSTNPALALEKARGIKHPWYRCQALTTVSAAMQSAGDARTVLEEALKSAYELEEPNRIVSLSNYPIGQLAERNLRDVTHDIDHLLEVISTEPHSLRRSDALYLLLWAAFPIKVLRHRVLSNLLASLSVSRGWRSRRVYAFTALCMLNESRGAAEKIIELIPESKEKRQAQRMLDEVIKKKARMLRMLSYLSNY